MYPPAVLANRPSKKSLRAPAKKPVKAVLKKAKATPYFSEANSVAVVQSRSGAKAKPRVKQLVDSLVKHLHAFLKETEPSLDEWMQGPLAGIATQGKELWLRVFDDIELSENEHIEFLYFVFSAMSGITTFARITGPETQAALVASNLGALKELLLSRFMRVA